MQADEIRRREIEAAGYLMLRFWNREIVDNLGGVCETILVTASGSR
jgi:very-short-patch-repair endonuclease